MECDHCGREQEGIAYTCSQCGEKFCEEHRLPEAHRCPALSAERARQLEDSSEPWFKDEFRLSNVEQQRSPSRERRRGESKTEIADACETCGKELLEHEIAGCPHCGDAYCGEHIAAHRTQCQENTPGPNSSKSDKSSEPDKNERWRSYKYDTNRPDKVDDDQAKHRWKEYGNQEQNDPQRSIKVYLLISMVIILLILGIVIMMI